MQSSPRGSVSLSLLLYIIFRCLYSNDPESTSFLVVYLIQISTQHLLNSALVYGLNVIFFPRTYASTLASAHGAAVLILSALDSYILLGGGGGKWMPPSRLSPGVWTLPTTFSCIERWQRRGRGQLFQNCRCRHRRLHRHSRLCRHHLGGAIG